MPDKLAGRADRVMTKQTQHVAVCTFLLTVPSVPLSSAFVGSCSVTPEPAIESCSALLSILCSMGAVLVLVRPSTPSLAEDGAARSRSKGPIRSSRSCCNCFCAFACTRTCRALAYEGACTIKEPSTGMLRAVIKHTIEQCYKKLLQA